MRPALLRFHGRLLPLIHAAVLVLLTAAAGAGGVAADLGAAVADGVDFLLCFAGVAALLLRLLDLGFLRQPGHRFFYAPDEVEPLERGE